MTKPALTVLQVIPELSAGGAERTTLEIAEAIKRTEGRALVVSEGGRLESELIALGGEVFHLPVKSKSPFTLIRNADQIAKIIRTEKVDIVHARSRAPGWSALWAARQTRTPFVTTYHGTYGGTSAPKKLYNSVMARGDIVIANSDFIADHVRTLYTIEDSRLVTIPRGVDTEVFDPGRVSPAQVRARRDELLYGREFLIVLPGRLTDWKGQTLLVEALGRLNQTEQNRLSVCLIGDAQGRNEYFQGLQQQIASLNLDEIVRISGHTQDMPTLLAASDLVIAPSKRPEAFGRVAIEAGAMARPVIVADHGGQRETVMSGETGWRFTPNDVDALAMAIRGFLEMPPASRRAMGEAARSRILVNYTKQALQDATLKVYERLMGKPGGS